MPRVFSYGGLDYFFYSNEGREPMHIHVRRGDASSPDAVAKYWLIPVQEAYRDGFSAKESREIQRVIKARVAHIRRAWLDHFGE